MLQLTGELFIDVILTCADALTKDDDILLDTSAADTLGEISIQMWRTSQRKLPFTHSSNLHYMKLPGELQLHKRSKKLTSHHIEFGEEVSCPTGIRIKCIHLDEEPIVTFIFKYRPLDILKANGIVPSTFGQQNPAIPEPEVEDTTRQGVAEVQNVSAYRMEVSEVGRCFVKHGNPQGQQYNALGQNCPATAEPEVGAIKREEGSRNDIEGQSASANRVKTSEKRPATTEPDANYVKQEEGAGQSLDDDSVFPDRIKALEEELNNLKRMFQQSTANKAKQVKVEASSSKNVFQPGEVINLT
ncbi:hypothetical protein PILCRDRAFT_13420 [Piloderma croceum F 1598]|uniref:DUF7918 domain-containing protein n=1 Tax=Piloderma croceum (strain F 1598) TaxID=765440 RepID=A0A0C3F6V1_PILCF|nr:hypothetical protein PILCRDRAFT_13420 [Piloderma croceum F 1598]